MTICRKGRRDRNERMQNANWIEIRRGADYERISQEFRISPILARLLRNRDVISDAEIESYLNGTLKDCYDPYLLKGMEEAVALLKEHLKRGGKIRVIGDYDADGIDATYILVRGIRSLGGTADYAIPHRIRDGYGLNERLIEEASDDKVDLIVTCDNGIAAAEQIRLAKQLGIDVIVTDHHEVPLKDGIPVLPPADALIDPKQEGETYPFPGICGAVVAYKFMLAAGISEELAEEFLQPAAIATVCDVMELKGENRILVKEGLKRLQTKPLPGIKALMTVSKMEPAATQSYHLGFVIGPCLNASGRLEDAAMALELLFQKTYDGAVPLANTLKELNDSRKDMTRLGEEEAIALLEQGGTEPRKADDAYLYPSLDDKVQVVFLPDCHESLAGIVAGRLRERYNRPALVITRGEDCVKGSARSVEAYDMFHQLSACGDLFIKFGGHKMAAGFSLREEDIPVLRKRLNETCSLTEADFVPTVRIDSRLPFSMVTEQLVRELEKMEPFGVGNSKPLFAQSGVFLTKAWVMGKEGEHIRFRAVDETGKTLELVRFRDGKEMMAYLREKVGNDADLLFSETGASVPLAVTYQPEINEYNGRHYLKGIISNYK